MNNPKIKYYIFAWVASLAILSARADNPQHITLTDSAKVSLLTCTPGNEVYSRFGHSAVRVEDSQQDIDWTFNYGVFNFNSDHFYARFVKGETWYQLDVEPTDWFIESSAAIGRTTYYQVLDLTSEERQAVLDALLVNYEKRNRYYLYNFVFDNCATRPYAILSRVIRQETGDSLSAPLFCQRQDTYRQRIRHYAGRYSWFAYGVNLIFGKDADQTMKPVQRLFLPEELMNFVSEASLADGRHLCLEENGQTFKPAATPWILSPYAVEILLGLLLLFITLFDLYRSKMFGRERDWRKWPDAVKVSWWADISLLVFGGLLGCVMFYLSYFSIHPLVKHNLNLLIINPLLLIAAILLCIPQIRHQAERHLGRIGGLWLLLCLLYYFFCPIWQTRHWLMILPALHSFRWILIGKKQLRQDLHNAMHKDTTTKAPRLLLLTAILTFSVSMQAVPRLTVVVQIDGLNQQPLSELRDYWQQGGLRTLDEDAHESEVSFPHLIFGGSESLATILTGTTPSTHGFASDNYFLRSDRKIHSLLEDEVQAGIGCDRHLSPRSLLAPTLTDEFRIRSSERSRIYAIGIEPTATILLAGHAANACAWIEPEHQGWATTGYYSEGLPRSADEMNTNGRFMELAQKEWTPRMDVGMYMHPSQEERQNKGFRYNSQEVLRQSPSANTLVVELALAMQKEEKLGMSTAPDMLLLQLNVVSPLASSDLLQTAEQEDLYLRLNQDLGYLMEQLQKRIGKENIRLIVFGTPHFGQGDHALERANLPVNFFNTDRAAALINTYLMAIYGHERWIDGSYGQTIYLNRTLIEQKKMSLSELQQQVSNFLLEFEGTESAYAITQISLLPGNGEQAKLRQTCNKRCFGDVLFTLQPLWKCGDNPDKPFDRVVDADPTVPFFILTTERTPLPEKRLDATDLKAIILQ